MAHNAMATFGFRMDERSGVVKQWGQAYRSINSISFLAGQAFRATSRRVLRIGLFGFGRERPALVAQLAADRVAVQLDEIVRRSVGASRGGGPRLGARLFSVIGFRLVFEIDDVVNLERLARAGRLLGAAPRPRRAVRARKN